MRKALVQRFGADRDPEIAENVAWAQTVLAEHARQPRRRCLGRRRLRASDSAQAWFALGCRLHGRVGRAADAERAYREAIAAGDVDAWLNLGIVLAGIPGREVDEQAALRMALGSDNPETASWAALKLGIILDRLQGDLDGARACFEIAAERGTGVTDRDATANLAFLAAYRGDRAAARDDLLEYAIAFGAARDIDMTSWGRVPAAVFVAVASRPTRRLWRWYRRGLYQASRRRQALVGNSFLARRLARSCG